MLLVFLGYKYLITKTSQPLLNLVLLIMQAFEFMTKQKKLTLASSLLLPPYCGGFKTHTFDLLACLLACLLGILFRLDRDDDLGQANMGGINV